MKSNYEILDDLPSMTSILDSYKYLISDIEILQNVEKKYGKRVIYKVTLKDGRRFILKRTELKVNDENFSLNDFIMKIKDSVMREYFITRTFGKICKESIAKVIDLKEKFISEINLLCIEMLFEYGGTNLSILAASFEFEEIISIAWQLVCVLEIMEEVGIAHFDIKPSNLVYENRTLKLIDFGSAISNYRSADEIFKALNLKKIYEYSEIYSPPELLKIFKFKMKADNSLVIIPQKVDTFCLGITLLELFLARNGCHFDKERSIELIAHNLWIQQVKSKLNIKERIFFDIIEKCLNYLPESRPSFKEIKEKIKSKLFENGFSSIILRSNSNEKSEINLVEINDLYLKMGEYDVSIWFLKKYIAENLNTTNMHKVVLAKMLLGTAFECTGQFWLAFDSLVDAMSFYFLRPKNIEFFQILVRMGNNFETMGFYEKSIEYYFIGLNLLKMIEKEENRNYSIVYDHLGKAYSMLGKDDIAIKFYKRSIEIVKKYEEEQSELAITYDKIGISYINVEKYNKALYYFKKSLEILERKYGKDHPQLEATYDNLGIVYYNLKELEIAIKYFTISINISKKFKGEDSSQLAIHYNNLSNVYMELNDFETAIKYLLKSKSIHKRVLGNEHIEVARVYNGLGSANANLGEYEMAIKFHMKALRIRKMTLKKEHPDIAQSYNNLGFTYYSKRNPETAIKYFILALRIQKKVYKKDLQVVKLTYFNLGTSYLQLKRYSIASFYLEKSGNNLLKIFNPEKFKFISFEFN